jgi:uncharacterized protein
LGLPFFNAAPSGARMHPKEQMNEDLKAAMKSGDTFRKDTLRLLLSVFKQVEVDTRIPVTAEQAIDLLVKEVKKRQDSIAEMRKAGRSELAENEEAEVKLIEAYLPTQMTRDEIEAEVKKAIAESGAQSAKDMGNVMKVLMPRVKGKADGKVVNEVVKALLG